MAVLKNITNSKKQEKRCERLATVRKDLELQFNFSDIVGRSPEITHTLKLVAQVARQNTTVLLQGESGTGKELLTRAIHQNSPRSSNPFIAINCSAFPDTLIESELFGYEKGAFTGAEKTKPGKLQLAQGGTLFLDEVTELSASAQAKILRVLQEREFQPLGSVKILHADVRIIAATNKNLRSLVDQGMFRPDLFYRLYVFPIYIPPLRKRPEDIKDFIEYYIGKFNREMGKNIREVSPEILEIFTNYAWPGNVRELQNAVEHMMVLSEKDELDLTFLPRFLSDPLENKNLSHFQNLNSIGQDFPLGSYVWHFEASFLMHVMNKFGFNQFKSAEFLGIPSSTMRYKIAKVKKSYQRHFCNHFLTVFCKSCQESTAVGRKCIPLMDNFFHFGLSLLRENYASAGEEREGGDVNR